MKRDASTEQSGEPPRGCYLNEIVCNLAKKSKVLPSRKNTYTMNRGGNKKELIFWGGYKSNYWGGLCVAETNPGLHVCQPNANYDSAFFFINIK